jgi:hypothetical protein
MTDTIKLRRALEHAATVYDQKEEAKDLKSRSRRVNIYRLGIILGRVNDTVDAVEGGADLSRTLRANFCDRLLTIMEKAAGAPVLTDAQYREHMAGKADHGVAMEVW